MVNHTIKKHKFIDNRVKVLTFLGRNPKGYQPGKSIYLKWGNYPSTSIGITDTYIGVNRYLGYIDCE